MGCLGKAGSIPFAMCCLIQIARCPSDSLFAAPQHRLASMSACSRLLLDAQRASAGCQRRRLLCGIVGNQTATEDILESDTRVMR
jgi:hypothetical protein